MSELHPETWAVFEDDSERMMQAIEQCLLALESSPEDLAALDQLFRELHTLKGSAGFLGLVAIGTLTHAAEDLVDRVREGEVTLSPRVVGTLLETLDLLRVVVGQSEGGPLEAHLGVVEPMCDKLRACAERREVVAPISPGAPRKMTPVEALDASEHLWAQLELEPSAGPRLEIAAAEHLRRLAFASHALGVDEYTALYDRLADSLRRERPRFTRLWWRLGHRVLTAVASAGAVLFDEAPVEAAAEDPSTVKVFVAAITELANECTTAARALHDSHEGPAARAALVERLDDVAAACAAMGLSAYAESFEALAALTSDEASEVEDLVSRLASSWAGFVEVQAQWEEATGLALAPRDDLRAALDGLDASPLPEVSAPLRVPAPVERSQTPPVRDRPSGSGSHVETATSTKATTQRPTQAAASKFLRVEPVKVESLMALTGEIGLAIGRVFNLARLRDHENEDVRIALDRVEVLIRELQDTSASLGLVPVSTVFGRMHRLVRDLAVQTGKKLVLRIEGGETEIDKILVDALNDPLIHLIRNAADHGIEDPAARAAAGKSPQASIRLSARQRGDTVLITIADDGRGLDREAIVARAIERGLVAPDRAAELSDRQAWALVFEPGFSTAAKVTGVSGRGIGMDAVKSSIQGLGGRVDIHSKARQGTVVTITLPLTLAFLDGMVVRVGAVHYVVPVAAVSRVFRVEPDEVVHLDADDVDLVRVDDRLIPALCLEDFFGRGQRRREVVGRLAVVVRTASGELAVPIDELVGNEQVTMKPLVGYLRRIRAAAGCALLRSGQVAIALNCEQLHDWTHADAA